MLENAMTIDQTDALREKTVRTASQSLALAMAYVPMQCLKNAYPLLRALQAGTLFPELDKPFTGTRGGSICG